MHRIGGGLALFWNSNVNVNITSYSAHHIDAVVCNEWGRVWRCIRIYGHPEASQKHHTWKLLKRLASLFSYLWCCFGDFNKIIHLHEKNEGSDRNVYLVADFSEVVHECNLMDMGYKGHPFTWSNRRYDSQFIEERLDRVICSKD